MQGKPKVMKNQDRFYNHFKAYLNVCKKYMGRSPNGLPLFKKSVEQCRANASGHFSFTTARVDDFVATASLGLMGNKQTQEYQELTSYLSTHEVIGVRVGGRAFSEIGAPNVSEAVLVGDLLTEYLRRNKSYMCNKATILSLYRNAVRFYSRKEMVAVVKCYLENVGIESRLFQVSENIQVRSLSPQEIETSFNINKCFRRFYSGPWMKLNRFKCIRGILHVNLSSTITSEGHETTKTPYDPRYRGQIIINNLLTAFRLHTLGDVTSSPVTVKVIRLPFCNEEIPWDDNMYRHPQIRDTFPPFKYRHIRRTFQNVTRFREAHSDADLLLNRLWVTTHRNTDEDVIVDSCIALETLVKSFLAKKSDNRMSSRDLAIHVSHLLGTNSEEREGVFGVVRDGFKLRNKVVHGSRMGPKTQDQLLRFSRVLREAIRRMIAHSPNISKKTIEDLVL